MFCFYLVFANFLYVSFYSFYSKTLSFLFSFLYLFLSWLLFFFFLSYGFSSFSHMVVVQLSFDFCLTFGIDGFTGAFLFLILVVFTSWCVYIHYYNCDTASLSVFITLLHISCMMIFVGSLGVFIVLLEVLSIPIFFLFLSTRSSDWYIGFSFLVFYSSLTGLCFLFSLSSMLYLDWFFFFDSVSHLSFFWVFISFLVKSAFFPVHSWLPYVHGLCSTVGSVFLAGVFLKLGSYGLLRVYCCCCLFSFFSFYSFIFVVLSFIGCLFSLFNAVTQLDFKKFIAFSSVAHMNFSVVSFIVGGVFPALLIWLSHGFITSLLFYGFGYFYSSFGSRSSLFFGNVVFSRLWYFHFVFLLLIDVGFPPFMSFYSELLSLVWIWYWSNTVFFLFMVCFLVSVVVTLFSVLRFSVGFSSFVSLEYTLPFAFLYYSFLLLYAFFSFFFVFDFSL